MNNKDINHSKRLQRTRQEFSQLTKTSVNNWKRNKEIKDKKRLEVLQNIEIEKINKELIDLRYEYKRITSERGSAHKWAQIVAKHESDTNEWQKRRNSHVFNRSKHILKDFINENTVKQNNIEFEKQNQILRRKQLMKSSVNKETDNKEVIKIWKYLNDLEKSEKVLKDIIKKKTELSDSEKPIQRIGGKAFRSTNLVPKQTFFDSNVLSNESIVSKQNKISFQTNNPKEKQKCFDLIKTDVKKLSEESVETSDYLPIIIATKLYNTLRRHQNINQSPKNTKVYRNVAISTSPQISLSEAHNDCDEPEIDSLDSSHPTSYLSFNAPNVVTNKATLILSKIHKNLNLLKSLENESFIPTLDLEDSKTLEEITLANNSDNFVDPLIQRINNLKELIDKKVEQNSKLVAIKESGDCYTSATKYRSPDPLNDENNEENIDLNSIKKSIDDLDAMSSNSSLTFKTLQGVTTSGRSSPEESSLLLYDINKEFSSIASNVHSLDSIKTIDSSILRSKPIRDRNVFWRDVFERAGIDIDINRIEQLLPNQRPKSEPTVDSFTSFSLSSICDNPNSHSTPKRPII